MLLFIFARNVAHTEHSSHGRLLEVQPVPSPEVASTPNRPSLPNTLPRAERSGPLRTSPSTAPAPTPTPAPTPSPSDQPKLNPTSVPTTSAPPSSLSAPESSSHRGAIMAGAIGGASVVILIVGLYFYGRNKVATVKPWATGLSGQLQKAFVTGIASFVMETIDLCKLKFLLISNCHAVVTVKPPLSI